VKKVRYGKLGLIWDESEMVYKINAIREGNDGVISGMKLDPSLAEVVAKLGMVKSRPALVEAASKILSEAQGLWRPQILYRWVNVASHENGTTELCFEQSGQSVRLTMGFSSKFLLEASRALIGVYTVGVDLENAATEASRGGRMLDGYLYDIVALAVLDQLKKSVNIIAEKYCQKHGWGVSPFLSPGSVHGWELEDQGTLCSLLPLETIDVTLQDNTILLPFKSVSFLIGTGQGYQVTEVGTTCEVCSKRNNCEMETKK
jgi:hypothetical protein